MACSPRTVNENFVMNQFPILSLTDSIWITLDPLICAASHHRILQKKALSRQELKQLRDQFDKLQYSEKDSRGMDQDAAGPFPEIRLLQWALLGGSHTSGAA